MNNKTRLQSHDCNSKIHERFEHNEHNERFERNERFEHLRVTGKIQVYNLPATCLIHNECNEITLHV